MACSHSCLSLLACDKSYDDAFCRSTQQVTGVAVSQKPSGEALVPSSSSQLRASQRSTHGVMLKVIIAAVGGGLMGACLSMILMQYGVSARFSYFGADIQQQQPQYNDFQLTVSPMAAEAPTLCSRDRPQGTESLPSGIAVIETDLFLRRLWGKPEEDLNVPPKYLLTITVGVGQKAAVNEAVKKFSEEWQILLFHYDGKVSEWDEFEWSQNAIHVSARRQAKWWYVKRFLHPDVVAPYDYIFIWDEDLGLEHFNATRYIELCKKYGLEISQPAVESPHRKLQWPITGRHDDVEVHYKEHGDSSSCEVPDKPPCAGFVEIMAPVFSRKAFRCFWYIVQNDFVHGWGLDAWLHRCVESYSQRIGIVDEQWIIHVGLPTLATQGKPVGEKEGVTERAIAEMSAYGDRWRAADAMQAELNAIKGN